MDIERDEDIWVFSIGNIVQDIGTVYQIYHCEYKKKSTECVSLDTQILFFLSTIARAFWVNDTYLRKVFISNIELFCSFIIHTYFIVYVIMSRNESTMNQLLAVKKRFWERWYFLAVITFGLGFFIHPSSYYYYRNYLRDIQMCVSFNIFTDAASLIPQLPLIYKEGDYFNELNMIYDSPSYIKAIAKTDCKLFTFTKYAFKQILQNVEPILLLNAKTYSM